MPSELGEVALQGRNGLDDSVEGEISIRHDANWEAGVTSNGIDFAPRDPGTTTVPGEHGTFSGGWVARAPGDPDPGEGVVYLVDPSAPDVVQAIVMAS